MSNYGVLVVECENSYQIIAEVSTRGEALEMAANYLDVAGPEHSCLAPDSFVINRRGAAGFFTVRELLSDEDVNEVGELQAGIKRLRKNLGFAQRSSYSRLLVEDYAAQLAKLEAREAALLGAAR
jgi:hypothetical protein